MQLAGTLLSAPAGTSAKHSNIALELVWQLEMKAFGSKGATPAAAAAADVSRHVSIAKPTVLASPCMGTLVGCIGLGQLVLLLCYSRRAEDNSCLCEHLMLSTFLRSSSCTCSSCCSVACCSRPARACTHLCARKDAPST